MQSLYSKLGIIAPNILLPKNIDLRKWAVVACDQYTSQKDYWKKVEEFVAGDPSTLNLILPEAFLDESEQRVPLIQQSMNEYLEKGILHDIGRCMIYLERKTRHNHFRKGLVLAVDLERYDYHDNSKSFIRTTEGTVLDRIPPRLEVRESAMLELPHIMLLIDDTKDTVIGRIEKGEKLYDFDLMMDAGHITGYKVKDTEKIMKALESLIKPETFYGGKGNEKILFAVGDGNHSLATAKVHWENMGKKGITGHPARYALVEVVNVHDDGLNFEPIHRVVFNADEEEFFSELEKCSAESGHAIDFITKDRKGRITLNPRSNIPVGTLQVFLDEFCKKHPSVTIDYIHGDEVVERIAKEGNIGFILPPMDKNELFRTVVKDGSLPRKTFSMGHADEKRFYVEARRITL
ncbi:DUF1015 domain-containing protein [Candidatus Woesearchaeota archaeon]|nr:DUF1015 domain-containing protein [Candidatus Woesearchaeota archaeon]